MISLFVKNIVYFRQDSVLACDGKCYKAWGINSRPRLYFFDPGAPPRELREGEKPRNLDDYVFKKDSELGDAPEDPGTYEGDHAKPQLRVLTNSELMNKWCARECERSTVCRQGKLVVIPDLETPRPNMRGK